LSWPTLCATRRQQGEARRRSVNPGPHQAAVGTIPRRQSPSQGLQCTVCVGVEVEHDALLSPEETGALCLGG